MSYIKVRRWSLPFHKNFLQFILWKPTNFFVIIELFENKLYILSIKHGKEFAYYEGIEATKIDVALIHLPLLLYDLSTLFSFQHKSINQNYKVIISEILLGNQAGKISRDLVVIGMAY